jgi:hypothetical protein
MYKFYMSKHTVAKRIKIPLFILPEKIRSYVSAKKYYLCLRKWKSY